MLRHSPPLSHGQHLFARARRFARLRAILPRHHDRAYRSTRSTAPWHGSLSMLRDACTAIAHRIAVPVRAFALYAAYYLRGSCCRRRDFFTLAARFIARFMPLRALYRVTRATLS